MKELRDKGGDPEGRAFHASCLARYHLHRSDASQALLRVIRDKSDDVLLREEVIEAFMEAPLRKRVKVEESLAPEIGKVERTAVERTIASAGDLLAFTQQVKSMDEIVAATRYEGEFVRALADTAMDEENHILLRAVAVEALERIARVSVESGVYDAKSLRLTHETLKALASLEEDESYYSGAASAFVRLEGDARFVAVSQTGGRALSSQK